MEVEPLKEEKARLEAELRASTRELGDILFSNDELIKENKEKELLAAARELYLTDFIEKNQAELLQVKSEKDAMVEKCNHDLAVKESGLDQLQNFSERFKFMKNENAKLEEEIANVTKIATEERFAFADQMHQMNKVMHEKRQNLESSLKRELNEMDLSCQFNAFSNLDAKKKKEMLTNAKLKDELAIQSIGISNLGARLSRQTEVCEKTKRKMAAMEQKAETLRDRLSEFRMKEMERAKTTKVLKVEEKALKESIGLLLKENSEAEGGTKKHDLYQTFLKLQEKKLDVQKWENRLACLKRLNGDLLLPIPVNLVDRRTLSMPPGVDGGQSTNSNTLGKKTPGKGSAVIETSNSDFGISATAATSPSASPATSPPKLPEHAIMTLPKLREFKKQMVDEGFVELLEPLRGRESSILLNNGVAVMDNNAIAWVVHELMRIWQDSENSCKEGFAHLKKKMTSNHYFNNISPVRTAPITRQSSTVPFLLGEQEHASMASLPEHGTNTPPRPGALTSLMQSSSFEMNFAQQSRGSNSTTPAGTLSPLMRSGSFSRTPGGVQGQESVDGTPAPGALSRTGSFQKVDAAGPAGRMQRSASFMMNELQAQKVMQSFANDDESDLSEREMEDLWDQIHIDAAIGAKREETTAGQSAQWMKKSNGGSHFVEHLGCSATVSSLLQRNEEVRMSGRGRNQPDDECFDKDTGINVMKYRFTSSIVGGCDLVPPASVKTKYVPNGGAGDMKATKTKAPKVVKKSRAAEVAAMCKTDGLMLKHMKQAGINGAASISHIPVATNHFTKPPKEDLEEVAARSISVSLRKTHAQLNRKISKLKVSLSDSSLIGFPPIQNNNM